MPYSRFYEFLSRQWWLTFLLMGVSFVLFGLVSVNFEFLTQHGFDAIREGGLLQLVELVVSGYVAAFFYVVFKLCEKVLVERLSMNKFKGTDS